MNSSRLQTSPRPVAFRPWRPGLAGPTQRLRRPTTVVLACTTRAAGVEGGAMNDDKGRAMVACGQRFEHKGGWGVHQATPR
jgi:hypothetical protein